MAGKPPVLNLAMAAASAASPQQQAHAPPSEHGDALEDQTRAQLIEQLAAARARISQLEHDAMRRQMADTPKHGIVSPAAHCFGMQVLSEGTPTPEASPLLLPRRDGAYVRSPPVASGPSPSFKLSSQVLTVGPYGIKQTTLMQVLRDSRGRPDRRGADTPRVRGSGPRHFDPDVVGTDDLLEGSAADDGSDAGAQGQRPGPARRSPPPPLDSNAVGRAAIDGPMNSSICSIGSPILPMTPGALDRIATVFSLEALRSDKMLAQHIPQTARAAMDYVAKAFSSDTGTFAHNTDRFFRIICHVVDEVIPIVSREPLYQRVSSPCYVFGDIHGNFRDLHYFLNNIVNFQDLHYTPSNVLFLGDYVDRGPYGLECTILLLGLKLSCPNQVTMLRGNHEDPLVNGDIRHYGNTAFKKQCQSMFGQERGDEVWDRVNKVFKHLPLAAEIDRKIFCTHGGIPRYNGGVDERLETLQSPNFPRLEYFSVFDDCLEEERRWIQMACDLCWSDPKEDEYDADSYWGMDEWGFARNTRGAGTLSFGTKAVDAFLQRYGFEYIFRAHQEKTDGLRLSKSARVLTIFSTSDYEGHRNGAALVFVNHRAEIRMIIKQPT